jgi:hypothetical protein
MKCVELLKASAASRERAKGGMSKGSKRAGKHRNVIESPDTTQRLSDLNISKDQSSRWQKLAENPKAVKQYLHDAQKGGEVPNTQGAMTDGVYQ